jgi:hypothetical protein
VYQVLFVSLAAEWFIDQLLTGEMKKLGRVILKLGVVRISRVTEFLFV